MPSLKNIGAAFMATAFLGACGSGSAPSKAQSEPEEEEESEYSGLATITGPGPRAEPSEPCTEGSFEFEVTGGIHVKDSTEDYGCFLTTAQVVLSDGRSLDVSVTIEYPDDTASPETGKFTGVPASVRLMAVRDTIFEVDFWDSEDCSADYTLAELSTPNAPSQKIDMTIKCPAPLPPRDANQIDEPATVHELKFVGYRRVNI